MKKQNQIQIYLVSIFFSFFYLVIFTSNIFATKQENETDNSLLLVSNQRTAANEFPRTVGTLSREGADDGYTISEWEDKNIFNFVDSIAEFFTFNIDFTDRLKSFSAEQDKKQVSTVSNQNNQIEQHAQKNADIKFNQDNKQLHKKIHSVAQKEQKSRQGQAKADSVNQREDENNSKQIQKSINTVTNKQQLKAKKTFKNELNEVKKQEVEIIEIGANDADTSSEVVDRSRVYVKD